MSVVCQRIAACSLISIKLIKLKQTIKMKIIQEIENQKRNKLFHFTPYLLLLDKECGDN